MESTPNQPLETVLVDTAVNPFVVIDSLGTVTWAGASVEELLGVTAADLVGRSMLDFLTPASQAVAIESLASATEHLEIRDDDAPSWEGSGPLVELLTSDGSALTCSVAVATPNRTGLEGFVLQLRRAESDGALRAVIASMAEGEALGTTLHHLARVVEGELALTAVSVAVGSGRVARVHGRPEVADLTRLLADTIPGAPWWQQAVGQPGQATVFALDDLPREAASAAATAGCHACWVVATPAEGGSVATSALILWRYTRLPIHPFAQRSLERAGQLTRLALRWEQGRTALEWAASHDNLTGLANRQVMLERLRALEPGSAATVLYIDLDDFKPVNEDHGHPLGDRVLAVVADRLERGVRPDDLVARLGGDEFGVLCGGTLDTGAVDVLAARLIEAVSQPISIDGLELKLGASIGIADTGSARHPHAGGEELLARADEALREVKRSGKGAWLRHDTLRPG
jgi:diguanylate cyclase (GGDEF)-like protein